MFSWLMNLGKQKNGAGLVEYALLIALVALVAVAAVLLFGDEIVAVFDKATSALQNNP